MAYQWSWQSCGNDVVALPVGTVVDWTPQVPANGGWGDAAADAPIAALPVDGISAAPVQAAENMDCVLTYSPQIFLFGYEQRNLRGDKTIKPRILKRTKLNSRGSGFHC